MRDSCSQCCSLLPLFDFGFSGCHVLVSCDMNPTYYPVSISASVSLGSLIHVASVYTLSSIINMVLVTFHGFNKKSSINPRRKITTGMSMGHPSRARKSTWRADNACMVSLSTCHYLEFCLSSPLIIDILLVFNLEVITTPL